METQTRTVTIAKRRFELGRDRVERAVRSAMPEPIASHFVVIDNRRYPPKQAIGLVTGLDRADFTTHQARRVLMGLGFPVGRRVPAPHPRTGDGSAAAPAAGVDGGARRAELARTLRAYVGLWVAIGDEEVLIAARTPHEVVGWLARHDRHADSMFRVPEDELALNGLAPL